MIDNDNVFKAALAVLTAFISWVFYGVKQNTRKHEHSNNAISELQRKAAITEEHLKHVLTKLDDVIELGADLKRSNNTILKALARKAKGG